MQKHGMVGRRPRWSVAALQTHRQMSRQPWHFRWRNYLNVNDAGFEVVSHL